MPSSAVKSCAQLPFDPSAPAPCRTPSETGETIISGMGELHLDIYVERMRREYKVGAERIGPGRQAPSPAGPSGPGCVTGLRLALRHVLVVVCRTDGQKQRAAPRGCVVG